MTDLIDLNCPSCLGHLQITRDIEQFTCRYCGAELAVTYHGDREPSVQVVQTGPDRLVFDGQEYASPTPAPRRRASVWGSIFSVFMVLFWCCVFPLIFILPPLFTDAGKCAVSTAQDHPDVVRELGRPIQPVFALTFLFSQEGSVSQEQYLIVVNGPKGVGLLWVSGYVDPTGERLEIEFEKDGRSYPIYGGPLDCSAGPTRLGR